MLSEKHVALMNEGVGDPMSYRKRKGRFTILEWLMSVILPILVILLGAVSCTHIALLSFIMPSACGLCDDAILLRATLSSCSEVAARWQMLQVWHCGTRIGYLGSCLCT